MNEKQVAFIICSNNDLYTEECIWYINQLIIPEDFSVDIITIKDADYMTQGYNAAMNSSNAKYKVYLHQDTFIINRNFIRDIVQIFLSDEKIGMIGLCGGDFIAQDGIYFDKWNVGGSCVYYHDQMIELNLNQNEKEINKEVYAIDGMIMVTSKDIAWREDLFTGWDFYDVSQSFEMRRAGYKIVVPFQTSWWCIHDFWTSNVHKYYKQICLLMNEYVEYYSGKECVKLESTEDLYNTAVKMETFITGNFRKSNLKELKSVINQAYECFKFNQTILCTKEVLTVLELYPHFMDDNMDWESICFKYHCVRFLVMRALYGNDEESEHKIDEYMKQGILSSEMVEYIKKKLLV